MKGAHTREGIERAVGEAELGDGHVTQLGVHQAVQRTTADDHAATDAGPDGHVETRIGADRRAIGLLPERRRVHVGVERDGHAQPLSELRLHRHVVQASFGVRSVLPASRSSGPNMPTPSASMG